MKNPSRIPLIRACGETARRHGWAFAVAAVSLSMLCAGCSRSEAGPGASSPAVPVAPVASAVRTDLSKTVIVEAELRPYQEVDLHAKVSGYLQKINVDIGDRVKAGDLIAVLEVPELNDELNQAVATRQRAEADYNAAHFDYTRLLHVNQKHPGLVAEQDINNAAAKDGALAAELAAAGADEHRYQTLVGYTRIVAPFDGVVTERYADPGALIQAGTSSATQSLPIIRLAENSRLRLDFPVTESYTQGVRVGDPVEISVGTPARIIHGLVARFTRNIRTETRTMRTEVDVPNPDLRLIPGMYATVTMRTQNHPDALAVPLEAVSGGASPTVFLVTPKGKIESRAVTTGLETATQCEVLAGLRQGDLVVVGDRSRLQAGQTVEPKIITPEAIP